MHEPPCPPALSPPRSCVAGGNLADARYFVRGVRECGYMVLSLAVQHCGAAMWRSEQLAALLPAAVAGGAASLGDNVVRGCVQGRVWVKGRVCAGAL